MRRLILGTAGHIDHGKTALVKALTGVDTDRLKEEKERGITIDLGFAEFAPSPDLRFGVVDVPGHEAFIRNMLAGATGVDVVLLVVAADEGIMPQTREHLAIVELLGVPRLVVALTKADLVDGDWLELVEEEVRGLLKGTPYRGAPAIPVSARTGKGMGVLTETLVRVGREAEERKAEDVARLPMDRVFTVKGAGTVVTGTLWSGTLRTGEEVQVLPGGGRGKVRTLQIHGQAVSEARAGSRVAVGVSGKEVEHDRLERGQTLVTGEGWEISRMLTARVRILPDARREMAQGERLRLHLGTAEVMARAVLLEDEVLPPGSVGWVQLRLEEPLLARAGDRFVLRSYSPVTTVGGGEVAEVLPAKRRRLEGGEGGKLAALLGADSQGRLEALVDLAGWRGVARSALPHRTGLSPHQGEEAVEGLLKRGRVVDLGGVLFPVAVWDAARTRVRDSLEEYHRRHPLRSGQPLEELRAVLPGPYGPVLAEAAIRSWVSSGEIQVQRGRAALQGFRPTPTPRQEVILAELREALRRGGAAPPALRELAASHPEVAPDELEGLLRFLEGRGEVIGLEDGLFFPKEVLEMLGAEVVARLGGRSGLGPADFKEAIPVSRKHLLPILRYFDTVGITTRLGEERSVAQALPEGWP